MRRLPPQLRTFLLFFLAAFAVRIFLAWASGYLFEMRLTEMTLIGINFAAKGEYANPYGFVSGPTAHSTPPFPLFMAALVSLFGTGESGQAVIAAITCAVSALRCGLVPLFVEDAGLSRGAALAAGGLSVFYIGALETEIRGGLDGPFVALALLAIVWLSMRLWRTGSWQKKIPWIFVVICGFSALLNPQLIPVMLAILFIGVCACAAQFRTRFIAIALLTIACMFLVLLPWGIRNKQKLGAFILTRSDLGMELWMSNGPDRTFDLPSNYGRLDPITNKQEAARVAELGEVAYNREKMGEAVSWIQANRAAFLRLTMRRLVAWWFPPGNLPTRIAKAVLTFFAFAGLCILWRTNRVPAALFLITWLTLPDIYYVIEWSSRFRVPMDWQLIVCAALTLSVIWRVWVQYQTSDDDDLSTDEIASSETA